MNRFNHKDDLTLCLDLQVRQVSRGLEPSRRHEGAFGRVPGRQRPRRAEQGLRGVLPVPLFHQGVDEEELRRKQPLRNLTRTLFFHKNSVT